MLRKTGAGQERRVQREYPGFGPSRFAACLTKIHREGKIPPPEKSLFRVRTLVLLSIFYNLVHVALGM